MQTLLAFDNLNSKTYCILARPVRIVFVFPRQWNRTDNLTLNAEAVEP